MENLSLVPHWKIQPVRVRGLFVFVLLLLFLGAGVCPGAGVGLPGTILASQNTAQSPKSAEEIEYQVKAAFLYNFMKFTEWPKEIMDPPADKEQTQKENAPKPPMVIGIVGTNPFGRAFDPLMDKKIKDRPLQVVQIPGLGDYLRRFPDREQAIQRYFKDYEKTLHSCHVLFFCDSERGFLEEHIKQVQALPILTVGDMDGFVRARGIIGFVKEDNKVRFEVQLTQAEKQQLKISSQLLKLAKRVIQEKDTNDK